MPDAVAQNTQHVLGWCRETLVGVLRCLSLPIPHVLLPQPSICFRETFQAMGFASLHRRLRERGGDSR